MKSQRPINISIVWFFDELCGLQKSYREFQFPIHAHTMVRELEFPNLYPTKARRAFFAKEQMTYFPGNDWRDTSRIDSFRENGQVI